MLQRFELFCKQGFKRTVSDSDYENTVKIIGCDSHDKRNSSFSEVSVTDGPAMVNLFRKPDLRREYRHFRQPLRMMGRRSTDREPSRISLTKILRLMKCRELRKKDKKLFTKSFPLSSVLHNIASNYKQWNIRYIQRLDCFYSSYFTKIKKSTVAVYNESEKNILLSGDVESNPGPVTNVSTLSQATTNDRSDFLLNYRLLRHGLNQLDVEGGGDCIFKSVSHQLYGDSHQLYGDSHHHLEIRSAGIQYMRDNPERFIESVLDSSWSQYISNMSQPGTWADHIIIQAVADSMNLQIHIIESNPNFTEMTLVEATSLTQNPRCIYIGHIDELHYISTFPALSESSTNQVNSQKTYLNSSDSTNKCKRKSNDTVSRPNNSRMPFYSVYENMLHEQASTTKTKKQKISNAPILILSSIFAIK